MTKLFLDSIKQQKSGEVASLAKTQILLMIHTTMNDSCIVELFGL